MIHKLLPILIFYGTVMHIGLTAQASYQWSNQYGYNLYDEYFNSVVIMNDGNILVGGSQNDNQGMLPDPWIYKINSQGDSLYAAKLFIAPGTEVVQSIKKDEAGNVYITGTSDSTQPIDLFGDTPLTKDIWIIKMNDALELVWAKMYPIINSETVGDLLIDQAHIWVAGSSTINDTSLVTASGKDYLLMKIDSSTGDMLSYKTYGGSSLDEALMIISDQENILMGGYTQSADGDVEGLIGFRDCWLLAIDTSNLTISNQYVYGFVNGDVPSDMIRTSDGGYCILGQTASPAMPNYHGIDDIWVLKLDSNKLIEWQYAYGGTAFDAPGDVVQLSNGKLLIGGYSNSLGGDIPLYYMGMNQILFTLDPLSGVILDSYAYGGDQEDGCYDITIGDEAIYTVGYTDSNNGDLGKHGNHNGWAIKFDIPTSILSPQYEHQLYAYPNPTMDKIMIKGIMPSVEIILYNSVGQRMELPNQLLSITGHNTLDLSSFTSGIYFLCQGERCIKIFKH